VTDFPPFPAFLFKISQGLARCRGSRGRSWQEDGGKNIPRFAPGKYFRQHSFCPGAWDKAETLHRPPTGGCPRPAVSLFACFVFFAVPSATPAPPVNLFPCLPCIPWANLEDRSLSRSSFSRTRAIAERSLCRHGSTRMLGEAPDRSFSFVVLVLLLALLIPPARTRKDYENEERGRGCPG
jgi:hypothetical protein